MTVYLRYLWFIVFTHIWWLQHLHCSCIIGILLRNIIIMTNNVLPIYILACSQYDMHLNSVHVYLKMLDFLFSCKNLNGTSVMICFLSITSIFIFTPILNERYYGMIDFNPFVIIDSFSLIYYPYYSKRLYIWLIHANIFFPKAARYWFL